MMGLPVPFFVPAPRLFVARERGSPEKVTSMATTPHKLPDTFPPMCRLRGLLAERRISTTKLAATAGLNRAYLSNLLNEGRAPGELAQFKLARALQARGLDCGVHDAA